MRSRQFIAAAVVLAVVLVGAGAVYAYDHGRRNQIAPGITVSGIPIGGLQADQARAKLRSQYLGSFNRPVTVVYHAHRFQLDARQAGIAVDIDGTVQRALARSRSGSIITRVVRGLTGSHIDDNLTPTVHYSRTAVARVVGQVVHAIARPARDASISYGADSLSTVPSRPGVAVDGARLRSRLAYALTHPAAPRAVPVSVAAIAPKVSESSLARDYPAIILVDRSNFRLRFFKDLRLVHTYTIAVGRVGLETPAGLYHVQDKQVNPSWHVPNSSWAGALAGKVIPPGPQDPIKARWMGIFDGAGIHGTDELSSLGSAASHGCIRMAIPDVIQLYSQVPVGAPVYIA